MRPRTEASRAGRTRTMVLCAVVWFTACFACRSGAAEDGLSLADREFFEARVRPVLVERCYRCHNSSGEAKGGLALDHRAGLAQGGKRGAVIDASDPAASLLLRAVRHELDDLRMPKDDAKLSDAVIDDLSRWLEMGAPDPRDAPPSAAGRTHGRNPRRLGLRPG